MCYALIKLNSIKDLYSFVDTLSECPGDYEVVTGQYSLNPRSLMSLLSLDLSKPFKLSLDSADTDQVLQQIQPFILHE